MIPSRYHLVRTYWCHTGYLTEPYVLDRRERTVLPYRGSADARVEWAPREEQRACVRSLARFRQRLRGERTRGQAERLAARLMEREQDCGRLAAIASIWGVSGTFPLAWFDAAQVASQTTISLNNNYVAGTGGNAIGARFQPSLNRTINEIYFFISSYTGTAANVTDLNLEVRAEASAGATTPNTAATLATATKNPSSATGWIRTTGFSLAVTEPNKYFIIVGDANGSGTDFATVLSRTQLLNTGAISTIANRWNGCSTTNGWSTSTFSTTTLGNLILVFSDASVCGNPITTASTPSSNTQQRGLRITTSGLIANLPIFGVQWTTPSANVSGIKIFTGNTAPDGMAAQTSTDPFYGGTSTVGIGFLTNGGTPYTLTAGTAYSIVAAFSANSTAGPRRSDIGTGEDANLRLAMPGGGQWYWRQDDGASSWSNDLVGSIPSMGLLVDGQVAAGAAGGVILPANMSGGFQRSLA